MVWCLIWLLSNIPGHPWNLLTFSRREWALRAMRGTTTVWKHVHNVNATHSCSWSLPCSAYWLYMQACYFSELPVNTKCSWVFQVFGQKSKYSTNQNLDLVVAWWTKQEDSFFRDNEWMHKIQQQSVQQLRYFSLDQGTSIKFWILCIRSLCGPPALSPFDSCLSQAPWVILLSFPFLLFLSFPFWNPNVPFWGRHEQQKQSLTRP